jgi:hypothetical protein
MLVKYSWITVQKVRKGIWKRKITHWSGLFLLGFIPIFIWDVNYTYDCEWM